MKMFASLTNIPTEENSLAISQWINWCRLCAKEDSKHNINFLYQNEEHLECANKKLSIHEALAKYFWIQVSRRPLKVFSHFLIIKYF